VTSYLKGLGWAIDAAENGAVELFQSNRYDVVLMDG
jgi:CheY-like chemotaxis protein